MMCRSGWIASALLAVGLLLLAGQAAWAGSHEAVASKSEVLEQLDQTAEGAGKRAKQQTQAGKQRGKGDRDAAARPAKAKRKKGQPDEMAAKRESQQRAKSSGGEGRQGGEVLEHRSERAAERANTQGQEGATRGQERARTVREAGGEAAQGDLGPLDAEAGAAAREMREQGSSARRGKGEPPEQAKGFWSRLFGSGGSGEE